MCPVFLLLLCPCVFSPPWPSLWSWLCCHGYAVAPAGSLSAAAVGFILVIDRRQDRWSSVKGTLLRIAVSLTAAHHVVRVCARACVCVWGGGGPLYLYHKGEAGISLVNLKQRS